MKLKIDISNIDISGIILENGTALSFEGSCSRCGACCMLYRNGNPCEHLIFENKIDENGNPVELATCSIYFERPLGCHTYPLQGHYEGTEEICTLKSKVHNG